MVGCAPTREPTEKEEFSCVRRLYAEHCSTRLRFRVMPHNSRSHLIPGRPSPHEEIVISCQLGVPVSVATNMHSSGRGNKAMTMREQQDKMLVARSRDKILYGNERRREWLVANRRTTAITTTATATSTFNVTTSRPPTSATSTKHYTATQEFESEYTDPTLEDSLAYDDYEVRRLL